MFFVVYKHRSGSTYLATMLSRHPGVVVAPESRFLPRLYAWSQGGQRQVSTEAEAREVVDLAFDEPKFAAWGLDRSQVTERLVPRLPLTIAEVFENVVQAYADTRGQSSAVVGIKKGGWYTTHLDVIHSLFPDARFVYLVRDGRAVFASSRRARSTRSGEPFERDAAMSAATWRQGLETLDDLRQRVGTLAEVVLEVTYEDLVTSTRDVLHRIFAFLGVQASDADVEQAVSGDEAGFGVFDPAQTLHRNVTSAPLTERVEAWRRELSPADIRAYERVAGDTLAARGYMVSAESPWYASVVHRKIFYRLLLARHAVARRMSGLRRRLQ